MRRNCSNFDLHRTLHLLHGPDGATPRRGQGRPQRPSGPIHAGHGGAHCLGGTARILELAEEHEDELILKDEPPRLTPEQVKAFFSGTSDWGEASTTEEDIDRILYDDPHDV